MIGPVTGWFGITEYNNKKAMTIENLVETTWLPQYPWTVEIMHDQGGEFLGYQFKSSLIEQEYVIKTKPASPGNTQASATIEKTHQVIGNLVRTYNLQETYGNYSYPWMGILEAAAFTAQSTYHRNEQKVQENQFWDET